MAQIMASETLRTNLSESIKNITFQNGFENVPSVKWRPFCLGLTDLLSVQDLDPSQKSHNAPDKYPAMHLYVSDAK